MAAATTAQFLVSEVIDFRRSQPMNHRKVVPFAVTEVSAHQAARKWRRDWLSQGCIKSYVKLL